MKHGFFIGVLAAVAISLGSCGQGTQVSQSSDVTSRAKQFVDLLARGDFPGAAKDFDAAMKAAMTPGKLGEAWGSLTAKLGPLKEQTGVRTAREQGYDSAYVTCKFERGSAVVKVVFDSGRQVSGLWFLPSQ
jgi:hypothetical protein